MLPRCRSPCASRLLHRRRARRGCVRRATSNRQRRHRVRNQEQPASAATQRVRPPPNSIACRRIPPPSRRWRFPGARSPSRPRRARSVCSTTRASRRPISPTPPINWMMTRTRARRPVTFLFNGGPGAASAYSAVRRCRTLAARHQRRRGDFVRVARSPAQRRDLARLHRSRLHRSRRHRLQPLRRDRR